MAAAPDQAQQCASKATFFAEVAESVEKKFSRIPRLFESNFNNFIYKCRQARVSSGQPSGRTSPFTTGTGSNMSNATEVSEDFERDYFFSRFELYTTIKRGGHWEMVKAIVKGHPTKSYAVKKFWRWGMRKEHEEALVQEVDILKGLDHDHVVRIFHFFPNEVMHFYVVLEHLEGKDLLNHFSAKKSYSEGTVRRLCRNIVSAIDHVHMAGVVHRDIKPESFVLAKSDDESSVKLTDFGAACFLEADSLVPTKVCTDKLMAPEMLKSKRHGTSVDMWNIGHVVHILIVGVDPE
ncbi:unnamed protein product, partial [Ascophyllum nodosum]